jgi:hypothetical protein
VRDESLLVWGSLGFLAGALAALIVSASGGAFTPSDAAAPTHCTTEHRGE